jgi:hypothetical protein
MAFRALATAMPASVVGTCLLAYHIDMYVYVGMNVDPHW